MNPIINAMAHKPQINDLMALIQTIKSGNPSEIFDRQMRENPQFQKFVDENKGKSPEEIAEKYGIDYNMIRQFLK